MVNTEEANGKISFPYPAFINQFVKYATCLKHPYQTEDKSELFRHSLFFNKVKVILEINWNTISLIFKHEYSYTNLTFPITTMQNVQKGI